MVGDKRLGERDWLIAAEFAERTALHGPTAPHEATALHAPTALHDPPAANAPVVRPAQLPAAAPDFTGRADAVRELSGLLAAQGGAPAQGSAPPVLAVSGIGGIGKTALAVHVAHAARRHFPDGQLYVDLRGAGPSPAEPDAVLAAFLRSLGIPDAAIPDGTEERTALYRSALAGRRILVLLDNARDADQIRPLLPGDPGDPGDGPHGRTAPHGRVAPHGCATLVTGRATMAGLDGAHLVDLDVMSPEEAFSLFALIVGEERAAVEREEVMDVLASCGFLPLAIRIAASRLASRRTWTVSVLARKLADERRRLDELRAGDLAVKASFELGYGQLEPEQARAFRLLGLAGGPDISLSAAAAVFGLDDAASRTLMESLVGTSLLEPTVPGRYRLHDLLRLYARTCAERDDIPEAEREAALSRLLDFYLATAARVYAAERPGDRTVEHLAPTTRPGLTFESSGAALEWLFTEADCLIACARQCVADGRRRRVADLLTAALDLAESGARSYQYEGVAEAIIESAQSAGDVRTEARARATLGNLYYFTGRFEHAERELERALDLAARDPMLASRVPNRLGSIVLDQGRKEEAEAYFNRALDAFRADANEAGEASALSNLARVHIDKGRAQAGVELAEQALEIYQRLGASLRLANGRYTLGIALTRTGRLDEALTHLTQALGIFRDSRQQLWEGMAHFRLAETHLAAGRPARAAWHAERSLAMQGLCGEWRRGSLLTVLGKALSAVGQTDRARECWQEALAIYQRLGSPEREEVSALMGVSSISSAAPPHGATRLHSDPPGGMTAH
ncbi:tetratricopeptide repeat protein [Streptomyces sp. NPDC059455]|uniref:tetratricopeptide repeat protein n=1 Tax=Streptomyces sp. NPDC059455 TaxID=3346837 RepID=UPI003682DF16